MGVVGATRKPDTRSAPLHWKRSAIARRFQGALTGKDHGKG